MFAYSLLLTGEHEFFGGAADSATTSGLNAYKDNWLGGLAMHMAGPVWLQLILNAFVVFVGFLILSGAVNTSIVGSNGVLSRVAEDGVLPDWFLKPHRRYGTHYRVLYLIAGLQLFTILVSHGDVIHAGRSVCVRRGVEFRVQHPVDGRAAVQRPLRRASSRCRLIFIGAK